MGALICFSNASNLIFEPGFGSCVTMPIIKKIKNYLKMKFLKTIKEKLTKTIIIHMSI
jgi:hypothetical protein